ncbi:MAG TPA: creatininase family protein [Thermomicrobiales bacterium]|nr:creatininase family protein [Thermomicrobiales bacterium]
MSERDLRRLDQLTWPEFRDRIERAVLIVPFGAVEQHGYHLPLGVDAQLPFQLALAAASRFPAIVAPPIWFGYKSQPRSGGGGRFPGTITTAWLIRSRNSGQVIWSSRRKSRSLNSFPLPFPCVAESTIRPGSSR